MSTSWVFDQAHYDALNIARGDTLRRLLPELKQRLNLKTALDLGCGVGHFAELLHNFGLEVLAVDGRAENVEEAKRRYPQLRFEVIDAQDPALSGLGRFDLVFCFGLLYHLENPFRVIRSISNLTSKLTLIEGMVYPSPEPAMVLLDENDCVDQGLNLLAFYPSETCLVKMLRRSGFSECYLPSQMPNHPDYQPSPDGFRRRTLLAASRASIESAALATWPEPSAQFGAFSMVPLYPVPGRYGKIYRQLDKLLYGSKRTNNRY